MLRNRVIPVLLLQDNGLVKTKKFEKPVYVGDPINAVRIFNEKEVDELALLDITRARTRNEPDYEFIKDIVSEAFMPIAYGGAVESEKQIEKLFRIGIEKVILNTAAVQDPQLISRAAAISGSQSIVVAVDVLIKKFRGAGLLYNGNKSWLRKDIPEYCLEVQKLGAGEIILTNVNHEGMMCGYDLELIHSISEKLNIPLVAHGGAASIGDLADAVKAGASAVAAGSMFVFQGKHRAVLITYPDYLELEKELKINNED